MTIIVYLFLFLTALFLLFSLHLCIRYIEEQELEKDLATIIRWYQKQPPHVRLHIHKFFEDGLNGTTLSRVTFSLEHKHEEGDWFEVKRFKPDRDFWDLWGRYGANETSSYTVPR